MTFKPAARFGLPMIAVLAVALASGQGRVGAPPVANEKKPYGKVHFHTKVGSFKMLGVNAEPAEGRIEINFTGSLLVTGKPKIEATGALRKEYERKDKDKVVYHGTGKVIIDGKFWGIQWFGRDMSAVWHGFGVARLYGEFDKDLNTGEYWYEDQPAKVGYWGTQGAAIQNPPARGSGGPVPRERGAGKPQR